MKTRLHFEGPSDLSVGTIRIHGEGAAVAEWIATPDNRSFHAEDLKPGIYSTEIGPVGLAPQSVLFEVREGQDNQVVLPSFSALSASGNNTSFFDVGSGLTQPGLPASLAPDDLARVSPWAAGTTDGVRLASIGRELPGLIRLAGEKRRIAIGLSEEKGSRDSFDCFRGEPQIGVFAGRIEVDIAEDPARDPWAGHRVRMSAAIEGVRIERCLLPMYRGGTRITLSAPPFAAADLELSITPSDPHVRAMLRALDAGTSDEAREVQREVVDRLSLSTLAAGRGDPWVAMLVGLLAIRFPDIFPPIDAGWAAALVEQAGWAFDAHVIRASQVLSAVQDDGHDAQEAAVAEVLALFARAQVTGAPYYRFANQLFGELAAGIESYLQRDAERADPAVRRFERIYRRWHRELPLQRGAGATFTWLSRDQDRLRDAKVIVPNRNPSGQLHARFTLVVFEGEVSAGQISFLPGRSREARVTLTESAVARLPGMPALARPIDCTDDPNQGRFGGVASRDGFRLAAVFEPTSSADWTSIVLTVEAEDAAAIGLEDVVWFVLHPTFSPSTVKVAFRGRRAEFRVRAWGGFTVGAWIPRTGIELELDLARAAGAPAPIRER